MDPLQIRRAAGGGPALPDQSIQGRTGGADRRELDLDTFISCTRTPFACSACIIDRPGQADRRPHSRMIYVIQIRKTSIILESGRQLRNKTNSVRAKINMNHAIVIMICGLPGSGKTFFAARLAADLDASHLSSDQIRRELFSETAKNIQSPVKLYSGQNKSAVYEAMLSRMQTALSRPAPVILDANFGRAALRKNFQTKAQAAGARFYVVHITADENVTRRRIDRPRPGSDADFAVYLKLRDAFEPPDETHLILHSDDTNIERMLHRAMHYVYGAPLSIEDIAELRRDAIFQDAEAATAELIETHISWVLLGRSKVYKIKKPVRYSFLDFSRLLSRYYFCRREVRLNSRLSDIYQDVRPIRRDNLGTPTLKTKTLVPNSEGSRFPVIGFAVEMQRIDACYEMDRMLAAGLLRLEHVRAIAAVLARFHREQASVIRQAGAGDARLLEEEFADLEPAYRAARERLGASGRRMFQSTPAGVSPADQVVAIARNASHEYLTTHTDDIRRRGELGLVRDCHGDCHSRNIFLPPNRDPVLFDCIEFSDKIRRIDLLNEIAFLCMDLDALGHGEMIEYFLESYFEAQPAPEIDRTYFMDPRLFAYFLSYRANIRAKVALLRIAQSEYGEEEFDAGIREVELYLNLMAGYVERFAAASTTHASPANN